MSYFEVLQHRGLLARQPERPTPVTEDRGLLGARYASHEAFRDAGGARRALSTEHDFGVMWREGTRRHPRYRVSWVEATGELYAVALSEFEQLRTVELLGLVDDRCHLEELLSGWEAIPYGESTLDWVRERIANA